MTTILSEEPVVLNTERRKKIRKRLIQVLKNLKKPETLREIGTSSLTNAASTALGRAATLSLEPVIREVIEDKIDLEGTELSQGEEQEK